MEGEGLKPQRGTLLLGAILLGLWVAYGCVGGACSTYDHECDHGYDHEGGHKGGHEVDHEGGHESDHEGGDAGGYEYNHRFGNCE